MTRTFLFCVGVVASTSASAGPWTEFNDRCLVPVEDFAPPFVSDLPVTHHETTTSEYALPEARLIVRRDAAADLISCDVIGAGEVGPTMVEGFRAWSTSTEPDRHYEILDDDGTSLTAQSDMWREPRLNVSVSYLDDGQSVRLSAEETDLES